MILQIPGIDHNRLRFTHDLEVQCQLICMQWEITVQSCGFNEEIRNPKAKVRTFLNYPMIDLETKCRNESVNNDRRIEQKDINPLDYTAVRSDSQAKYVRFEHFMQLLH